LILSVGLIPENELAESLGIPIDKRTKGPISDQDCMTMLDGVFCCGNALHENDLVDYVSESGEAAGQAAAWWASTGCVSAQENVNLQKKKTSFININTDENLLYVVPQRLNVNRLSASITIYFRSKIEMEKTLLTVKLDGKEIYQNIYPRLRPSEIEKFVIDLDTLNITNESKIKFSLTPVQTLSEHTHEEITSPTPSLTTTVRTIFPDIPVLPVKIKGEVSREKIPDIIRKLSTVLITKTVRIGETVVTNILETGCDIVTTNELSFNA